MATPDETPIVVGQAEYQPQWGIWTRQFMTTLLVIGVIFMLTLLAPVANILFITMLLAFLMHVPARFLARETRLNYAGAVAVIYLLLIVLIVFLLLSVIPGLLTAAENLRQGLEQRYADLVTWLTEFTPGAGQGTVQVLGVSIDLDPIIVQARDLALGSGTTLQISGATSVPFDLGGVISFATATLAGIAVSIANLFSTSFLALFLSFLILLDLPNYQGQVLRAIPPLYHRELLLLVDKMMTVWNGFFRGQLTLGLIIGLLTWLQLTLMGVSDAAVLALVVALISLIPTIGGIIALVPLGIVPLLQGSTVFTEMSNLTFALLVVAVNLVISQVIWNVVAPKIMGDAVALPLPLIIIGIVIGTALGGALGAFLIVPTLGTLRVILFFLISKITRQDPFPGENPPPITDLATL